MTATNKGDRATTTILEAAEQLFLEQGYHGTSMREIAQAAGYKSAAGLYSHFPDKEAILVALLDARDPYDTLLTILEALQATSGADFLGQLYRLLTGMLQQHSGFFRLVLLDLLEFNAAHVQVLISRFQGPLLEVVARVQGYPDINPHLPTLVLIRGMAALVIGTHMSSQVMPPAVLNQLDEAAWQGHLSHILLHGILRAPPTPPPRPANHRTE
ncbi:MAG: TetR/AcrR family transcriptional regulator [Anaerolineae bacterium]|nr:TetR/AcrR family transcriptional regulator [Anaerolineae bacterium]